MRNRNYLVPFIQNYLPIFRELNLNFGKKTIILLKGQLGSGKTTFVKELLSYKYKFNDLMCLVEPLLNKNGIFCFESNKNKVIESDSLKVKNFGNTQLIFWRKNE